MEQVTDNLPSKSAKIRALANAGYPRSEIARFLDIRYQFVRNVLVEAERRSKSDPATPLKAKPARLAALSSRVDLKATKLRVDSEGRISLPAAFREALALREGDALIASVQHGELHLLTMPAAVRRAQAIVRQFVPEGVSLVDELLENRRREVEDEDVNG